MACSCFNWSLANPVHRRVHTFLAHCGWAIGLQWAPAYPSVCWGSQGNATACRMPGGASVETVGPRHWNDPSEGSGGLREGNAGRRAERTDRLEVGSEDWPLVQPISRWDWGWWRSGGLHLKEQEQKDKRCRSSSEVSSATPAA